MGFLKPKAPKVAPAPLPPHLATQPLDAKSFSGGPNEVAGLAGSLISTSTRGLRRKADTERTSLLGGY